MSYRARAVYSPLMSILAFVTCVAVLLPFFWMIYRTMIFQALPRDDYAPFVLWLLGQHGGAFPESPYGYRVLSAVAAIPFYELLPLVRFSNLPASTPLPYIRATEALAALSYVSVVAAAFVSGRYALRCGLGRIEATLAGMALFALCWYGHIDGIDPLAILAVTVLLSVLDRPVLFASGILVSIVLNEKICMIFVIWLTIRCALVPEDRPCLLLPWVASLGALALYFLMVGGVGLPGNSYQLQPERYPLRILTNIVACFSPRGVMLNIWPTVVLVVVALIGWRAPDVAGRFRRADLLLVPALVALALTVTTDFQVGRIVMHAAPIFVVPAAATGARWLRASGQNR